MLISEIISYRVSEGSMWRPDGVQHALAALKVHLDSCLKSHLIVAMATEPGLISMHYQLTNLIAGRLIRSSVIGAELRRNTE